MKKLICLLLVVIMLTALFACGKNDEVKDDVPETQQSFDVTEKEVVNVMIALTDGRVMKAELYPKIAPITVKNFVDLCTSGFYDGLIFHRVIKDFMIQGGDPLGNGTGGSGKMIKGEFSANGVQNDLKHTRGVLSMARRGKDSAGNMYYDTGTSQFFIVSAKSYPSLDGQYAAFGKLTEGYDVLAQLEAVQTDENDKPLSPITIKYIRVTD